MTPTLTVTVECPAVLVLLAHVLASRAAARAAHRTADLGAVQRAGGPVARWLFEELVSRCVQPDVPLGALGNAIGRRSLEAFDLFVRAWHIPEAVLEAHPVADVIAAVNATPRAERAA